MPDYHMLYQSIDNVLFTLNNNDMPLLDPLRDMSIREFVPEMTYITWEERTASLNQRLQEFEINKINSKEKRIEYEMYKEYKISKLVLDKLQSKEREIEVGRFKEELKNKLKLLRRLGYLDNNNALTQFCF